MVLLPPGHKTTAHFPASASGVQTASHPAFPVSRASRYNTLHLASKVVCQRGDQAPFGNPWFCRRVATVRIPAPVSPPLQNPKKRRRPAPPRADLRRFFVRPAGRDGRKNALEKLRFRVAFFDISGYNKLNPNRRLQHERSG